MKTKQDCLLVLHRLGIMEGDLVLLHHHPMLSDCIHKSATMVEALIETVGESGTVMMYQVLNFNQDPSLDPQISFDQHDKVRAEMMAFDYKRYRESFYDETFLALTKVSGRMFNQHPKVVVCAVGKYAQLLTKGQSLDFPFGFNTAFESLKQLNGKILHFSEDFSDCHEVRHGYELGQIQSISSMGLARNGVWVKYLDYQYDSQFYQMALNRCDKKEVVFNDKKIQSISYQEALNQFIQCHPILFKELGQ